MIIIVIALYSYYNLSIFYLLKTFFLYFCLYLIEIVN